jgi:transcriptional regulator GlxA family with amidase domain
MSICTGANILATAGALEGRNATAPFVLLRMLSKVRPETQWMMRRWVGEGTSVWTSGGITNGMDMTAAWIREYFWDRPELVKFVLTSAAVGERGPEYSAEEREYWGSLDLADHDKAHQSGDLASLEKTMEHGGMDAMMMGHGEGMMNGHSMR